MRIFAVLFVSLTVLASPVTAGHHKSGEGSGDGRSLSEADLAGHLSSDGKKKSDKKKRSTSPSTKLAREDFALFEALNLLRGLSVYDARSS